MTKIKPKKAVATPPTPSTPPAANYNTFNLCKLIKILNRKKIFALKWLQKIGMLNRESSCDNCGRPMTLVHRQNCTGTRADTYEWECNKCRMCTKSLRSGTVFQSSKLSLQKITILMYFWAHDFPSHVAQRELSINERTVNKWYLLCQEACMDALIRNTCKLGGEGRHLEIVESKLGKRSVENYRTPAEHPAIGVIDVDSGRCFLQVVIGNTKATLLTLLKERIANGSILHSKCWRLRDCYSDEKFCKVVKNHKLTLTNENRNTFQKLHVKACKSQDKVGTEFSFDPVLCATIYKNAMKNEEFFFVKFLGELGTLYRDGIRYEMMSQLEQSDSEPGPSVQQRLTVSSSEKVEWTSTVGSPCYRCRSKQYSNSEVQATELDEIVICEDTDEAQNVSVSKQNVRQSSHLLEGSSAALDDIIMLDDTCKTQNGVTSEQTAPTSESIRLEQSSACGEVMEVDQPNKSANDGRSERSANTSGHIPGCDCPEANEVFPLEKHDDLPNSSAMENNTETLRRYPEVGSFASNGVVLLDGEENFRNRGRQEEVVLLLGCRGVIDTSGDEVKIYTNVSLMHNRQSEVVTNVGHIGEADIRTEEQIDAHEKVDDRETVETGVDEGGLEAREREVVPTDVDVMAGGVSEMVAHESHGEVSDITPHEQKDTRTHVIAETRSPAISKAANSDSAADNTSEEKVVPVEMIVPAKSSTDVASDVNIDDVEDVANERTVKGGKTDASPRRKKDENSELVNIDYAEGNSDERTRRADSKRSATPGGKTEAVSDLPDTADAEHTEDECTRQTDRKTIASPGGKRDAVSDLVSIGDAEDNANESTGQSDNKTSPSSGGKRNAVSDLVDISDADDDTGECTRQTDSKRSATPGGKRKAVSDLADVADAEDNADECVGQIDSKMSASPCGKRKSVSNLVNIDDVESNANKCTVKGSKTNTTPTRKREAASKLVNIDDAEDNTQERTVKRSKTDETANGKKGTASDLVNIDDTEDNENESTVKCRRSTVGKKRVSVSDVVNIDIAGETENEYTEKLSKTAANAERKKDTGSDLVNIDDNEDNACKQKDSPSKINAAAKRKSNASSDVVNIDDVENSLDEGKDVFGKTDMTAKRKSDVVSDVVNIDDVDDNADECEARRKSADRTFQKESAAFSDVIDIDELDSDVEIIETKVQSAPDVMVVSEQKRKVCNREELRHARRLLVDDVPCNLSKSVLKTYFEQFGQVANLKIHQLPSRRSQRYAVMEFQSKQIVDTIQAARPHVLESGIKLVTFRGSSPDIDSSLNTRLKERMIVKVQRDNMKLTTEDVQQHFAEYGHIYHIDRVTITGVESGSSTFVVSFEDYDSADVACINSPHTIKGVENVTCEKVEDDDLLLSGTEMDPICIEYDSDVEEVLIDEPKTEPSSSRQSQEGKSPDEPSTSGVQFGGGKRLSEETTDATPKKFCSYNTFGRNVRTPQNTTVADPTAVTNGRFGVPAVPGSTCYGGRGSGTVSWHPQGAPGRPFCRQTVQRPAQSATPAPRAVDAGSRDGGTSAAADGAASDVRSVQTLVTMNNLLAAALRHAEDVRKRQAEVRPYRPQLPQQRPLFHARLPQWQQGRRPVPQHFQPRRAQQWPPVKREPQSPTRPVVPIASGGLAGPSHVTRSRPGRPASTPANARSFIPRAAVPQGPRF